VLRVYLRWPLAKYTELCCLILPVGLEVASSEQTYSLSSYVWKKSFKKLLSIVSSSFVPWNSVGAYYLWFPLHLPKNALSTGFRGHKCNLGGGQAGGSPQYFFYLKNIFLLTTELKGVQQKKLAWERWVTYYLWFPLHLPKNAMNTGFRDHKSNVGGGKRGWDPLPPEYFF